MPGGEENSGSSPGATSQTPQTSQSTMFHQILPPQHLDLKTTGEIAENWKLWKEKYNNYFVISRLERESPEYQLTMLKHAIGDDGLRVVKTFSTLYRKGGRERLACGYGQDAWNCIASVKLTRFMRDIASTRGTSFLPKQWTVSSLSWRPWQRPAISSAIVS